MAWPVRYKRRALRTVCLVEAMHLTVPRFVCLLPTRLWEYWQKQ